MKSLPRLALLLLAFLPAACAAPAEQRVPLPAQDVVVTDASLARIYFVREDRAGVQKRGVRVFDGEREIGSLSSDTYLCWERPGGRSLGRAFYDAVDPSRGKLEGIVDLDCAAGAAYYFNVQVSKEDGQPRVTALAPEEGRRLVADRSAAASN